MKISRKVYFLILVIEECAEIIHRTCKAIRFGLHEKWKPEDGTNQEMLDGEIHDLQVILDLNRSVGNIGPARTAATEMKTQRKLTRVEKFLDYSFHACRTISEGAEEENPRQCYQTWDETRRTIPAGTRVPFDKLLPGMRVICPNCRAVLRVTDSYNKGLGNHEAATGPSEGLCGVRTDTAELELFEKFLRPKE